MKIAIIGYGDRGNGYAHLFKEHGAEISAICDTDKNKLQKAAEKFNLDSEHIFANEEDFWAKGKLADLLIVSTLDQLHHRHVMKAIELGYDILLEKPIATNLEDCKMLKR